MKKTLAFIAFALLPFMSFSQKSSVTVNYLRCEYMVNPTGIDVLKPRLSWKLTAVSPEKFGQRQTAYQIFVSNTKLGLENAEIWNSGWVKSDEASLIEYEGKPLLPDSDYYWRVRVKDESGKISEWSEVNLWTTGIFEGGWAAQWIGSGNENDQTKKTCTIYDPWFRKTFSLDKAPERANIFVASVGYHEVYVNGKKIGDHVLAPNVSYHQKRARYIAYDISKELKAGSNVIAIWLGTSWAIFPHYTSADKPVAPICIAQADIYESASKLAVRIVTDRSWRTHSSPNKLSQKWDFGQMGGEIFDTNLDIPNWNMADFDDNKWAQAVVYKPNLILSAQMSEPNIVFRKINPVKIYETKDGNYRVDMGVNFAGFTQIKVKGKKGDTVRFLISEREQNEMTFNNHSAIVLNDKGEATFKNRFNYGSGRWITIKGASEKPNLQDITGGAIRNDYKPSTSFNCSDTLQNWIYDNVKWTFENLTLGGYTVDCPQRERLGYGGDAHATTETGLFNYDLGAFYFKWMEDWRDVQGVEPMTCKYLGGGMLPHTAPTCHGGGGPSWGGICVTLPWYMYEHYGDKRILEENFSMMQNWLNFLDSHTKDGILQRYGGNWDFLSDWLWPGATAEGMNNNKPQSVCFNSCYMVFNLRTAAKIARVLGKTAEAEKWEQQVQTSVKAINKQFFNADDNSYSDRSMGNLTMALIADVPEPQLRDKVIKRLEKEIMTNHKGHINVGITGGAFLFKLLRGLNRSDLIYSMTSKTDYPSWGYMKNNDATTIWEMWEKDLPGHSLLHSSYLFPGAWYVEGVGGIVRDNSSVGFKHFIIRPPLQGYTNINQAETTFDSPVGIIKTEWRKTGGKFVLNVSVPANSSATLYFPTQKPDSVIESSGYAKKIGTREGYVLYKLVPGNYSINEL